MVAPPRDGRLTEPGGGDLAGLAGLVITDGKIGDRVQCLGLAEHLGLLFAEHVVRPRAPWSWIAPWGRPDPRDAGFGPPFPALAIASGRRAVPALRALKRASGGRTFTVFLKQPGNGLAAADLIWVPEHDRLRGPTVVVTSTSPSRLTRRKLAEARQQPDPRLVRLPLPRVAMMLGGPSGRMRFDRAMTERLEGVAAAVLGSGRSLMVTPSRRTPPALLAAIAALGPAEGRLFVWRNEGANPYVDMLALADALVVTGDSVNMVGEAVLTGAPVHVVDPPDAPPKITRFIDMLVARGAVRRWSGRIEAFDYEPIDATPVIAAAVAERFRAFTGGSAGPDRPAAPGLARPGSRS